MRLKWMFGGFGAAIAIMTGSSSMAAATPIENVVRNTQLGGYFDTEWFSANSSTKDTFRAHRLVLAVSSRPHERLFFNSEIEFEYGGLVNSGTKDGELKIEQAWLDYTIVPDQYFRAGIVLVPFGIINPKHDSDMRESTQRGIFASVIVPTTWMDTGIGFHGTVEWPNEWVTTYETYLVNGLGGTITDGNGLRGARPSFKSDNNNNKAVVARVTVSPMLGLDLGTSVYTGKYDVDSQKGIQLWGTDAAWSVGPFELLGEYATAQIDAGTGIPGAMAGYYVESRYHFFPDFLKNTFLGDGFEQAEFVGFARYGQVDTDTSVTNGNDRTQVTVGMNYRPIPQVVFKLEYEINREASNEVANDGVVGSVAFGF